jgi:predicted DNA-binding transcriptional regulator AlpA
MEDLGEKVWSIVLKHSGGELLISSRSLSNLLGVSLSTVYSWSTKNNGPIQPIRVGGLIKWSVKDVYQFISRNNETKRGENAK